MRGEGRGGKHSKLMWMRQKGHLDTYRFCDEVWTFLIKDVTFKMDNSAVTVVADKVKIVSCNAKRPGET